MIIYILRSLVLEKLLIVWILNLRWNLLIGFFFPFIWVRKTPYVNNMICHYSCYVKWRRFFFYAWKLSCSGFVQSNGCLVEVNTKWKEKTKLIFQEGLQATISNLYLAGLYLLSSKRLWWVIQLKKMTYLRRP